MITFICGGSASGKSGFGESLCIKGPGPYYYIATMMPYGEEGQKRVKRHRKMRQNKGFMTIEKYTDIGDIDFPEKGSAILECVGNLTANEMFDEHGNMKDPFEKVTEGIKKLADKCLDLVIISNDVSRDISTYTDGTNDYIKAMGRINNCLAALSDRTYEMVCGIPLKIKGDR